MAPLREALADFVPNLFLALGALLQFFSFALPWAIVLVPLVFGLRYAWRALRRRWRPTSAPPRSSGA